MTDTLHQPAEEQVQNNWVESRLGYLAAVGTITTDITPLNAVFRYGALAWAQRAYGDPAVVAAVVGGVSMALEGASAVATADVLASEKANNIILKINNKLDGLGVSKYLRTNLATEVGVASIGGTAAVTAVKHRQEPSRTRTQNRRYGLTAATGLSALSAAEGYLISNGIEHPNPVTIGIGALAIGGVVAGYKWAKNKISHSSASEAVVDTNKMTGDYLEYVDDWQTSPQVEGLMPEETAAALRDPRTVTINVNPPNESPRIVPFAVPLEYASWLNQKFLTSKGFDAATVYYAALPQAAMHTIESSSVAKSLDELRQNGATGLIVDYPESTTIAPALSEQHQVDDLMTSAGTPAAIYHYQGLLNVHAETTESYQIGRNVRLLSKQKIAEDFDQLWDIYESRFQDLVDDHPILGMIPKEELLETFLADGCAVSAYYDESNAIKAVGYIVDDIKLCPWLNKEWATAAKGEAPWVYFPGIAAAKDAPQLAGVAIMKQLTKETIAKYPTSPDVLLTFECTNISKQYIPKLVQLSMKSTGMARFEYFEELKHFYQMVKVG